MISFSFPAVDIRPRILPGLILAALIFIALDAQAQERFRRTPPYPDPLPRLRLPQIESETLTNGLRVTVARQSKASTMNLRVIVMAGESSSPDDLPGLASLTARMLNKGTTKFSSSEFEEGIESIGGNYSVFIYPNYSIFSFTFLEDFLDNALELIGEMFLNPTFPKNELVNSKSAMYYDLITRYKDPDYLARRILYLILFADHPYRKIAFSDELIKNLEHENCLDFFNSYYVPNNTSLVLTGDLSIATATRKVSHYLGSWRKKSVERPLLNPPPPQETRRICFVNNPQAKDATIYVGNNLSSISTEDYFPYLVFNQVIGGSLNSRLFMNLKESKGLAYSAFSTVEFFKVGSLFYAKARVKPETTRAAIGEIIQEIEKMMKEKVPSEEIEQSKSYLRGSFPLDLETIDGLGLKVAEIQTFELGEEHWNRYNENINVIDADAVFEVAKKSPLLSAVVVIVGDIRILNAQLADFEEVHVYDNNGIHQYTWKGELQ